MIRLTSKTKVTHADSDVSKYYNQLQKYENLEKSPEELEEVLKERYCEVACTSESAHVPRDRGQWFATSCNFGCSKLDLQRWVYCPKCGKKLKVVTGSPQPQNPQPHLEKGIYIQGFELVNLEEARPVRGWIESVHYDDNENVDIIFIQADDEYGGHRETTIHRGLGPITFPVPKPCILI